jgi:hypothetical protein
MSESRGSRTIKHVSFLIDGERTVVEADENGTFQVPVTNIVEGRMRTLIRSLTASELIAHPTIMKSDPVITLKTGEKIRVFDGGDSSYLPAMSQGIIERHDKYELMRRKFEKSKEVLKKKVGRLTEKSNGKVIAPPFTPSQRDASNTDEYDNPFHWDDDDDYGIF